MRKWILAAVILFGLRMTAFAVQNRYEIQARLDQQARQLNATAMVTFAPTPEARSVRFLLNRALTVTRVSCNVCAGFRWDPNEPSPYRYMPPGAPLDIALKRAVPSGEAITVTIEYSGPLAEVPWGVNLWADDYVELAQYIGWYPFLPDMGRFRYVVDLSISPEFAVAGGGMLSRLAPGRWRLVQDVDTPDIAIVAARGLRTQSFHDGQVQVAFVSSISDDDSVRVQRDTEQVLNALTNWFGPSASGHLTLVLNRRAKGGSYARPGFVSMQYPTGDYATLRRDLVAALGHELSHFWWTGAPVVTWEDWLNESFAQYSSWLVLKQIFGEEVFESVLKSAKTRVADTPTIWGIDRNADAAYVVLYDKGALRLHDLHTQVGQTKFLEISRASAHSTPRTTQAFLALLAESAGPDVRRDFEAALKR